MSEKITFEINGWSYHISAEDEFARYLKSKITKDFNMGTPDSRKAIINAYVKANYELFQQEKEMKKITDKLSDVF